MTRPRFHKDDGRPRYVGPATVLFPDGREVPVTASLVLRSDPANVAASKYYEDSTWAGNVSPVGDSDVDLFDAAPGVLRMPDGRESEFMATSGPPHEVGCSGIGPAPFG
ncbi:hypothetical protein OH809_44505 (plasmid) [Streptomyces sp. NBC_00873]|uniref:hypothetical protein n=1 Tax=unclassified Streptomyces TaxID=2593676 RepID=UPI002F90A83F|nr:hypothetical protein OH809_44505 [Streptomyces sp. NBC_00873]WTA49276.1 hypothetical protein OH821_44135 [Streptomyces sp. NBC_00842]